MPRRWEPTGRTLSSWDGLVACFEWGSASAVDARRPLLNALPMAGCAQWLAAILIETLRWPACGWLRNPGLRGSLRGKSSAGKTASQI